MTAATLSRWAAAGVTTTMWLLAGCAGHAETTTQHRPPATTAPRPIEVATAVRDDFDPARFRDDLLLIQPVFPPPIVVVAEPDPPAPAAAIIDSSQDAAGAIADSVDTRQVHRVQVIALSHEGGARRVAAEVAREFGVPVDVVAQRHLFAVHAGRFADPMAAGLLKGRIAITGDDYAGAFVVTDTLDATDTGLAIDTGVPTDSDELPAASAIDGPVESLAPETPVRLVRVQGWRVLVGQVDGVEGARDLRAKVMRRLRRDDVEIIFETPWFKVLVGNFRLESEAQRLVERCRTLGYRNAAKVPGEVEVPMQEGSRR